LIGHNLTCNFHQIFTCLIITSPLTLLEGEGDIPVKTFSLPFKGVRGEVVDYKTIVI
jgi:hypothetical protein